MYHAAIGERRLDGFADRLLGRLAAVAGPLWYVWLTVVVVAAGEAAETRSLDRPVGPAGTLSFKLHVDRSFRNGAGAENVQAVFLELPGVGRGMIQQNPSQVALVWRWLGMGGAPQVRMLLPELPGPETYFVQLVWDAAAGLCQGFVNGHPLQEPGGRFPPWDFPRRGSRAVLPGGVARATDVVYRPEVLGVRALRSAVPEPLRGRRAELFAAAPMPAPLDIGARRGRLLFDAPLASAEDAKGWVMEGPGQVRFADGWMRMRSLRPDATGGENGHIVFWCPRDFPERFVAEWDVQLLDDYGLCIVFFAARGEHGEDIFDPSLPPRDGTFAHYIRGAINSYHISYYANTPGTPGRICSNLRKNNKFYLLSSGPIAVPAGSDEIHHLRLIKDGGHIQLQADGRVSIDYADTGGSRYGAVYGGGKIGLRQMQWTVARYRNFRVWELAAE